MKAAGCGPAEKGGNRSEGAQLPGIKNAQKRSYAVIRPRISAQNREKASIRLLCMFGFGCYAGRHLPA